ncbi:MAG TPA: thiamine phosphate synthase [Polyangiales bacterium]|nr:thiamine phosphate synthase [Polyangiales bacterium]
MTESINKRARGLYAIIDPEVCSRDPEQVARAVLRGGCAMLQLRDKRSSDPDVVQLGKKLAAACRAHQVPFVLNDRYWLVPEVGAQGAHVGQTDAPLEQARSELGSGYMIGVSTHSFEQAEDAAKRGADLIGFGPVFGTSTKADHDPVVGLEALQQVVQQLAIPVVAIGGIQLSRAAAIAQTGVPLAAAVSAICSADNPEQAARDLHAALRQAHTE